MHNLFNPDKMKALYVIVRIVAINDTNTKFVCFPCCIKNIPNCYPHSKMDTELCSAYSIYL